jgi:hypothetical protein
LFLREKAITDLTKLAKLAEQYIDGHKSQNSGWNKKQSKAITVNQEDEIKNKPVPNVKKGAIGKKFFIFNKTYHLAKN